MTAPAMTRVQADAGMCTVDDCTSAAVNSRGWCNKHYKRWRSTGDPLGTRMPNRGKPLMEHVWASVDFSGPCWEWTGGTGPRGHGHVDKRIDGKPRRLMVHRVVWEYLVGPIPADLELDHLCRNTCCCNPDHLEPVTSGENTRRGFSPSGLNARKNRCVHGHDFTEENTYVPPDGRRICRTCLRAIWQRANHRRAAARREAKSC